MKINKNGYLHFHQGWADIINQLALIDYYLEKYDKITLLIREDSQPLIDFYLKNKTNIIPLYIKKDSNIPEHVLNDMDSDLLFHGIHDSYRRNFKKTCQNPNPEHFWKNFYICYGIAYETRVTHFNIKRNYELEQIRYDEFVKQYGTDYSLYHEDVLSPIVRDLKIKKEDNSISLTNKTNIFFDYIKILENAKEIKMVDSVWATILYHLDAKYRLFKKIPITINCLRNHNYMFLEPITLENWTVI